MVDDVKEFTETAESKEALDRSRLARERREAEQRKRLDELRAHAAAAQAQREKRDEDRRRRQAEQRAKDDDRRQQVEERKRAIWEASISRREALLQRERDRTERLERQRAARSAPRPAFAFGSSTPRLLDPLDSAGFFWAARSTNPIDQMNFFESLAASTTNVMFASAPLTRRASALQLDTSDTDNKDEGDRQPPPAWSSVARRRTDLVPTVPLGRGAETRSGETTPGSRPGSALSNATGVLRRQTPQRKPRPASIAGTGVNTPRGGGDMGGGSVATTPSVSRDGTLLGGGDAPRRAASAPRRPRPTSLYGAHHATPPTPAEGKPPLHRKPKPAKDYEKAGRGKSLSASPGRTLSPSPRHSKEPSVDKDLPDKSSTSDKKPVSAVEVTQKLEALQIHNGDETPQQNENQHREDVKPESKSEPIEISLEEKPTEKPEAQRSEEVKRIVETHKIIEVQKPVEKKEPSVDKTDESEMTASMTARRITTEEEAKAALAERRRRAREELERQAEAERQRLQREAEEEAERQRQEEERQRREEEEARQLAELQRRNEEEKLRKAIEAQQQLEREEAERKIREEAERQAKLREEEEKRKAAEEAEKVRKEEAEREEKERLLRKQRVEAIMARTRLRKAEEDKKQQEKNQSQAQPAPATSANAESAPTVVVDNTSHVTAETLTENATNSIAENTSITSTASADASITSNTSVESATSGTLSSVSIATTITNVNADSSAVDANAANASIVEEALPVDNGNVLTEDLLGFNTSQADTKPHPHDSSTLTSTNNGNLTADLLGLSETQLNEDKPVEQTQKSIDNVPNAPTLEQNNGNMTNIGQLSANFIQTERSANESQKISDVKLLDDDFTAHNGHSHPLTLQNAI